MQLTLDRTNWKWGKQILISDLYFQCFIANSDTYPRTFYETNSIRKGFFFSFNGLLAIFGKDRYCDVFADRAAFIGEQWFTWLIEQDINFCIRV